MAVADEVVSPEGCGLARLVPPLATYADFVRVVEALRDGREATLDGVWGSSCALVAAALTEAAPGPLVVLFSQRGDADDFPDELALFSREHPTAFPAWDSDPREQLVHDEVYGDRLRVLKLLEEAQKGGQSPPYPKVLVTTIQALLQPVPSREQLAQFSRVIAKGDTLAVDGIARFLVEQGFHATSAVELPGEFSVRGGILDIFAADWDAPVRIELFDDEVESIRRFDVATQRSLEALDRIAITALRQFRGERSHLLDYLPPETWFLLVEPGQQADQGRHYLERLDNAEHVHGLGMTNERISRFANVSAYTLGPGRAEAHCQLPIESVERFSGDFNKVKDELDSAGQTSEVVLLGYNGAEVERLQEIFSETRLAREGRLHFERGRLKHGFRLIPANTALVGGNELFHRTDLRRITRRPLGKAIDTFLDLRPGDLVVHLAHGIGRYRGLELLDKQGHVEEHLAIEFHGGTKVYVPTTKIDLVQKYVGGNKARPHLAKLGNKTWVRQKEAAAESVTDLAAELLELQANRRSRPGIAFGGDTDWQREFDAAFPYVETPDQLTAIEAIKGDMRQPRPMDRLLCGDVGFGKTELSMRAAFKAVDQGYQVAVLVPTTILAEQHFRTFKERMSEFPFTIGKLSRFASPAEQRAVVEGLATGKVDIVIGTHRLASADVQFENLGLVVIDEEQRFGVEVKERLKALRSTVDVLTMTATPIPRTLHFSLVGLRDISNLETPPTDRVAVETRVCRWDNELIRHAVMRELNRGGQIYFVHNRVNDIEIIQRRLKQIVPEANIRIGHGQMPEDELEQVMVDFVDHKFDLLLATTIVESGLDIPNANTIFIDESDRYGLSDLHQLRGRVGRYKHRAYCYLLLDSGKSVTPNAAKRLRAIEEFSDMGAGFAIAMRDLEIRGAGNILGTQQSGHIAAVGYELYCTLLEEAVRRMKHMPPKLSVDVTLDLPGEAYLPRDYVPDMRLKIDIYRRLARSTSDAQLADLRAELIDRFGAIPPTVERMFAFAELKIDAAIWLVREIKLEPGYMVFFYTDKKRIELLAKKTKRQLRVADDRSAYLPLTRSDMTPEELVALARGVLRAK